MITQEKLKELLHYDPDTGIFTRKVSRGGRAIGSASGTPDRGYIRIFVDMKGYWAHRLAWLYVYGELPKRVIDHINHTRDDNRIKNLRDVTHKENCRNAPIRSTNTSGVTGVHWDKRHVRWCAQIMVDGSCVPLGRYSDINAAILTRKVAERSYGFHVNHGDQK